MSSYLNTQSQYYSQASTLYNNAYSYYLNKDLSNLQANMTAMYYPARWGVTYYGDLAKQYGYYSNVDSYKNTVESWTNQMQSWLNELTNYINHLKSIVNQMSGGTIIDPSEWDTPSTITLKTNLTNAINNMFVLLSNKKISPSNVIGKDINNNDVPVTKLQVIIYPKCGQVTNGINTMPQLNDSNNPGIMLPIGSYVLETIVDSNKNPIKKIGAIYVPYGLQVELFQTCNYSNSGNSLFIIQSNACINNEQNVDFTIASIKVSVFSSLKKTIVDDINFLNQFNQIFGTINSVSTLLNLYLEASYQDYKNIFVFSSSFENAKILMSNKPIQDNITNYTSYISQQQNLKNTYTTQLTAAAAFVGGLANNSTYYNYKRSQNSVNYQDRAAWNGWGVSCADSTFSARGNSWYDTWWKRDGSCYYGECKYFNDEYNRQSKVVTDNAALIANCNTTIASYQASINSWNSQLQPLPPGVAAPLSNISLYITQYVPVYIKTFNNYKKVDVLTNIIAGKISGIDDIYNAWMK